MLQKLGFVINRILLCCAFAWMAVISVSAMIFTAYTNVDEEGLPLDETFAFSSLFDGPNAMLVLASLGVFIVSLGVLFLIYRFFKRRMAWIPVIVCLVFAVSIQLVWVFLLDIKTTIFPDTVQLQWAAEALNSGDFSTFHISDIAAKKIDGDLYFSLYPFQAGSLLYFASIFQLFPDQELLALQIVNVIANTACLICLFWINRLLFGRRANQALLAVLCIGCLPLYLSCALPYGNSLGLFFSVLSMALLIRALVHTKGNRWKGRQWLALIGSFASIAVAMTIKNTCILFLIGELVCLVIYACCQKRVAPLIVSLLLAIAANQVPGFALSYLEHHVNRDFGDGMPRISWIAMGLRDDSQKGMPGWWSFFPAELYWQTDGDVQEQSQLAAESIQESLEKFTSDPAYAWNFFCEKLGSEWVEPSYQGVFYSSTAIQDDGKVRPLPEIYEVLYPSYPTNQVITVFMDGYQILIYVGTAILLFLLFRMRRPRPIDGLLPCMICIGFAVYLLWEAKSIYILPYFVIMLPLAAEGWRRVAHLVATKLSLAHEVHGVQPRDKIDDTAHGRHEGQPAK